MSVSPPISFDDNQLLNSLALHDLLYIYFTYRTIYISISILLLSRGAHSKMVDNQSTPIGAGYGGKIEAHAIAIGGDSYV